MEETSQAQADEMPVTNIKDYIVNSRKNGFPDRVIIDNLKKNNWPEDVIQQAVVQANSIIGPAEEAPAELSQAEEKPITKEANQPQNDIAAAAPASVDNAASSSGTGQQQASQGVVQNNSAVPPLQPDTPAQQPVQPKEEEKKGKKGFSILSLIAFIFSPVPFIGLGLAMSAFQDINKNKKYGFLLALLAFLINLGIILFIAYAIYQIFTLNPDQLTGLSEYISKMFNIV